MDTVGDSKLGICGEVKGKLHKADAGGGLRYLPTDFSRGGAALTSEQRASLPGVFPALPTPGKQKKSDEDLHEKNAPFFFFSFYTQKKLLIYRILVSESSSRSIPLGSPRHRTGQGLWLARSSTDAYRQ